MENGRHARNVLNLQQQARFLSNTTSHAQHGGKRLLVSSYDAMMDRKCLTTQQKTWRLDGLVSFPTLLKFSAVVLIAIHVFGRALLFCIVTFVSYYVLTEYGATNEPEAVELQYLERRLQRGLLSWDECGRFMLRKLVHVYERIRRLSRTMLEYSFTLSIAESSGASWSSPMPTEGAITKQKNHTIHEEIEEIQVMEDEMQQTSADPEKPEETKNSEAPEANAPRVVLPSFASKTSFTSPAIRRMVDESDRMLAELMELMAHNADAMDQLTQLCEGEDEEEEELVVGRLKPVRSVHFSDHIQVHAEHLEAEEAIDRTLLFYDEDELDAMRNEYFATSLPSYEGF